MIDNNKIVSNNRGITLVILIITIIIVFIISGILVYTGIDLFEKSEQRKQISKLTLIQTKVKSMGEENLFDGKELVGKKLIDIKTSNQEEYNSIKTRANSELINEEYDQFYYIDSENLEDMGLKSVEEGEYLVNYRTGEIVILDGIKIEGDTLFTLSEVVETLDLAYIYIGEE